jgi:hypothetical protein
MCTIRERASASGALGLTYKGREKTKGVVNPIIIVEDSTTG